MTHDLFSLLRKAIEEASENPIEECVQCGRRIVRISVTLTLHGTEESMLAELPICEACDLASEDTKPTVIQ